MQEQWYVVGIDGEVEGEQAIDVVGPFDSETDAKAYAIDWNLEEEDYDRIAAQLLTSKEALRITTNEEVWDPYKESNSGTG